jgi:hypothetical protein
MVEFGEQGHLFEQFPGFGVIVVDDHFFDGIDIVINFIPTPINSSKSSFSNHSQFLIINLIPSSGIGVFGYMSLMEFLHIVHVDSLVNIAMLVEYLLQDVLVDLLVHLDVLFHLLYFYVLVEQDVVLGVLKLYWALLGFERNLAHFLSIK